MFLLGICSSLVQVSCEWRWISGITNVSWWILQIFKSLQANSGQSQKYCSLYSAFLSTYFQVLLLVYLFPSPLPCPLISKSSFLSTYFQVPLLVHLFPSPPSCPLISKSSFLSTYFQVLLLVHLFPSLPSGPLISKSSNSCINPFLTISGAPFTIVINVTFMFHIFQFSS